MPRGNRYRVDGYVWHITERCHQLQFLLKFARDQRAWMRWLYVARQRFDLCVLNYQVTCNHVHLLVQDRGGDAMGPQPFMPTTRGACITAGTVLSTMALSVRLSARHPPGPLADSSVDTSRRDSSAELVPSASERHCATCDTGKLRIGAGHH